jgi:hypothetical protein
LAGLSAGISPFGAASWAAAGITNAAANSPARAASTTSDELRVFMMLVLFS